MKDMIIYEAESVSVNVPVDVDSDPTGAVPQFSISDSTAQTPGAFVNGAWQGAYANGRALASSPLIGGAAPLAIVSGSRFRLWCKVAVDGETYCEPVATIDCP